MSTIASQITSLTIVYLTIYSGADQSKHQSSASLAFVWGIQRGPVNSPHKWPVTRKMFPFDDVIMGNPAVIDGSLKKVQAIRSFDAFLLSVWICCLTNRRVIGDLRCYCVLLLRYSYKFGHIPAADSYPSPGTAAVGWLLWHQNPSSWNIGLLRIWYIWNDGIYKNLPDLVLGVFLQPCSKYDGALAKLSHK